MYYLTKYHFNLKSNMDRFIDYSQDEETIDLLNLKSNMDRFIANGGAYLINQTFY